MSEEQLFEFVDEQIELSTNQSDAAPWIVLSVEDDPGYQQSLLNGLTALSVRGRPVKCITANSATSAAAIIAERNDIAVILLDVVMERDDAGLFLISTTRNVLGNNEVRIILLTGQPGMAHASIQCVTSMLMSTGTRLILPKTNYALSLAAISAHGSQ
ncbi:hypothetical protein HHX48_14160 [Salinimonas sp. HHU 13199]|uniref:Response regulatory domain-containing protein n=1 Tax=Salinimonas profundi TaxID=2729140 RepID=A0ABR8LPN4_9ALTE|nr:hypothetical protein [Salinimonas profundi]MBD3586886.1 hypothetical protein [Salinimonas profundi]